MTKTSWKSNELESSNYFKLSIPYYSYKEKGNVLKFFLGPQNQYFCWRGISNVVGLFWRFFSKWLQKHFFLIWWKLNRRLHFDEGSCINYCNFNSIVYKTGGETLSEIINLEPKSDELISNLFKIILFVDETATKRLP